MSTPLAILTHLTWLTLATVALAAVSHRRWRSVVDRSLAPVTPSPAARRLANLELPLVAALAPVLWFPTPSRLLALALLPPVWFAARRAGLGWIPNTPLNITLTLLLTLVGVSLWTTFDVLFSLGKVAGVLLGTLTFWAVVRSVRAADRLRWATAALVLSGAALAVIGLVGAREFGSKVSWLGSIVALLPTLIRGVPGAELGFNPNPVAGCLVLFLPLQIALLAHGDLRRWMVGPLRPNVRRLALFGQGVAFVLTAGTVVLMQSRGAAFGLLAAGVGWVLWRVRWARGLVAAGSVTGLLLVLLAGPSRVLDAASAAVGPGFAAEFSVRVSLWTSGLRGIHDAPWTGFGMNTFRKVQMERYAIPEITAHYKEVAHAHNNLLQTALDLGLPGLVAYLAIWMAAAFMLRRVILHAGEPAARALAAALAAGLFAHFVFGLTDAIPLGAKVGILFWMTLGVVTALHGHTPAPTAWRARGPH